MIDMTNEEVSKENILVCKDAKGLIFINHGDIICLKADGHYTKLFIIERRPIRAMNSLSSLKTGLPKDRFFQCHRSYIINTEHIVRYRKKCKELEMNNDIIVPVSRSNEKGFLGRFQ